MIMLVNFLTLALLATSAFAHSNMFAPKPRKNQDHIVLNKNENSCETTSTTIPGENTFQRGQKVPLKWWWNNHSGGFIKMSIVKKLIKNASAEDKAALLKNENIIQGQCYTRSCDRKGFDPGNTKPCNGEPLEFPDWLADGEYTLQWTHFGGYDSDGVPTRSLGIYKTCANIRIKGGKAVKPKPKDWIAPFFGGDQTKINGKSAGANQCAFKKFAREPEDPKSVNVKDDNKSTIKFGGPDGWAAPGKTNKKRADSVILPRLGHVARYASPNDDLGDSTNGGHNAVPEDPNDQALEDNLEEDAVEDQDENEDDDDVEDQNEDEDADEDNGEDDDAE